MTDGLPPPAVNPSVPETVHNYCASAVSGSSLAAKANGVALSTSLDYTRTQEIGDAAVSLAINSVGVPEFDPVFQEIRRRRLRDQLQRTGQLAGMAKAARQTNDDGTAISAVFFPMESCAPHAASLSGVGGFV